MLLNLSKNHQKRNRAGEIWLQKNRPNLFKKLQSGELVFQNDGSRQFQTKNWFLVEKATYDESKPLATQAMIRIVHGIYSNSPNTFQLV